jgi:hypothetical protein
VGTALLVELVLDEVQFLQQIFELAGALEELLVHVLQGHFEGFLTVSSIQQPVGVVGEVP